MSLELYPKVGSKPKKPGKFRFRLLIVTLLCLLGTGYLTYKWTLNRKTPSYALTASQQSYEKGVREFQANQLPAAMAQFDEAGRTAEKALSQIDTKKVLAPKAAEERNILIGELHWVKARAIRD